MNDLQIYSILGKMGKHLSYGTTPIGHNSIRTLQVKRRLNAAKWWYIIMVFEVLCCWVAIFLFPQLATASGVLFLASFQMAFKMFALSSTFTATVVMKRKTVTVMLYSGVLIRNCFRLYFESRFIYLFCFFVIFSLFLFVFLFFKASFNKALKCNAAVFGGWKSVAP